VTPPATWQHASIHTYDDHRMAMCFSLAAFNPLAPTATPGQPISVRIEDPRCVGKTFPDYFETLFQVAETDPALIPVITVDGPSASGKGTLANNLATRLGYQFLDSGSLYRVTGLVVVEKGIDPDDHAAVTEVARQIGTHLPLHFEDHQVWLNGREVSEDLRQEAAGQMASRISGIPGVREALVDLQLSFRGLPGLVADGRDMGTVIFPDAALKVFLTASVPERAERRYNQLISKGFSANLEEICADLEARDLRDRTRAVSPLMPAPDARKLDNSALTSDQSAETVLGWWVDGWPHIKSNVAFEVKPT